MSIIYPWPCCKSEMHAGVISNNGACFLAFISRLGAKAGLKTMILVQSVISDPI